MYSYAYIYMHIFSVYEGPAGQRANLYVYHFTCIYMHIYKST